jgi:hypothetical protein
MRFAIHDHVYKSGAGYEGPGAVVAVFKTWMGDYRYVVEHRIAGGKGFFYHIYSAKELKHYDGERPEARPDQVDPSAGGTGPSL